MKHPPLMSAAELAEQVNDSNLKILFAGSSEKSKEYFLEQHIQSAHYVSLNDDLSSSEGKPEKGGRHPLPDLEQFLRLLQTLGISQDTPVVVYDDQHGANASARLWWMLRAVGLDNVRVLDGGCPFKYNHKLFSKESGYPSRPAVGSQRIKADDWQLPIIDISGIEDISANKKVGIIIDVRESLRYQGITEPIDPIAGHIPQAINLPFKQNLDDNGFFQKPEVLRVHFERILKDVPSSNTAIHCGSGVTACHTILAMAHAGLDIPQLYVGSWSEWCRSDNKIERSLSS